MSKDLPVLKNVSKCIFAVFWFFIDLSNVVKSVSVVQD